jgi:preprotein translocase subunit SecF
MDFILRLPPAEGGEQTVPAGRIIEELQKDAPGLTADLRREELVGPRVGRELSRKATLAIVFALIGILIYIGARYDFTFALGGVLALAHNVVVTLLMFSIFNKEVTLTTVAALLTIGGYSINDTVVIFDRIREELRLRQKGNLAEIINYSVNQTLSRTLITSAGVFYTIAALLFLGGEVIHDFAFAMLMGVAFGTYASIYIGSALALELGLRRERVQREKAAAAA